MHGLSYVTEMRQSAICIFMKWKEAHTAVFRIQNRAEISELHSFMLQHLGKICVETRLRSTTWKNVIQRMILKQETRHCVPQHLLFVAEWLYTSRNVFLNISFDGCTQCLRL